MKKKIVGAPKEQVTPEILHEWAIVACSVEKDFRVVFGNLWGIHV